MACWLEVVPIDVVPVEVRFRPESAQLVQEVVEWRDRCRGGSLEVAEPASQAAFGPGPVERSESASTEVAPLVAAAAVVGLERVPSAPYLSEPV